MAPSRFRHAFPDQEYSLTVSADASRAEGLLFREPAAELKDRLLAAAKNCAFARGRRIVPVIRAKRGHKKAGVQILTLADVLDCLQ